MAYDVKKIMARAWVNARKADLPFGEALHRAWLSAKAEPVNTARIEAARIAAGVNEAVNTWAGWKEKGREVIHGSKCLFQTALIWGSRGDGATYIGSFFGESQTAVEEA